ncbi:MAG: hypothetical protein IPK16_08740 [Anaerolineales bacterium]|nr:hypothetical protein [Anaerolineales bacterium]
MPVVKIGSIKPEIVDLDQVSYVAADIAGQAHLYQLRTGDLLIAMTGNVGAVALVPHTTNPPLLNQRVAKVVLENTGTGDLAYVYCLLRSEDFRFQVAARAHGSVQPNISASAILSIETVIPPVAVRARFNAALQPVLDQILATHLESQHCISPRYPPGQTRKRRTAYRRQRQRIRAANVSERFTFDEPAENPNFVIPPPLIKKKGKNYPRRGGFCPKSFFPPGSKINLPQTAPPGQVGVPKFSFFFFSSPLLLFFFFFNPKSCPPTPGGLFPPPAPGGLSPFFFSRPPGGRPPQTPAANPPRPPPPAEGGVFGEISPPPNPPPPPPGAKPPGKTRPPPPRGRCIPTPETKTQKPGGADNKKISGPGDVPGGGYGWKETPRARNPRCWGRGKPGGGN